MGKGRAPCCDKYRMKRGSWSPDEDLRLISFVRKYGHENWRALPKQAGLLRCGKSCRLRWINYLSPNVKRGNFTIEEEDAIIGLHKRFGNKWSKIASYLPGRTDNEIKNVWNTHLKKRLGIARAPAKRGKPRANARNESSSGITSSSSSSSTFVSSGGKRTEEEGQPWDEGSSAVQNNLWPQETQIITTGNPVEPKELSNISSSSSSTMTSSSYGNMLGLSEGDIQFLLGLGLGDSVNTTPFDEVNKPDNLSNNTASLASPASNIIPFESELDLWNNFLYNIEPRVESSNTVQSNKIGPETKKYLKYLEKELGLDSTEEENQENVANVDAELSLVDSYLTMPEGFDIIDPGMGYHTQNPAI